MAKFEMNGKEYELKITYEALKELNKRYDSPIEFVGMTFAGNIEAIENAIYFGLIHTGEKFIRKDVEKQIEKLVAEEKLDYQGLMKLGYETVTESFLLKGTVNSLLKDRPDAKKELEALMK